MELSAATCHPPILRQKASISVVTSSGHEISQKSTTCKTPLASNHVDSISISYKKTVVLQKFHLYYKVAKGLNKVFKSKRLRHLIIDNGKLFLVTVTPLLVLLWLCGRTLQRAETQMNSLQSTQATFADVKNLVLLANAIIDERDYFCHYTHSERIQQNQDTARKAVKYAQQRTDEMIAKLTDDIWNSPGLKNIRGSSLAEGLAVDCTAATEWYTQQTRRLLASVSRPFTAAGQRGRFWAAVYAYVSLLKAKDSLDTQRALGGSFFAHGHHLPMAEFQSFSESDGAAEALLREVSWNLQQPSALAFSVISSAHKNQLSVVSSTKSKIYSNLPPTSEPDLQEAFLWFDNMTTYVNLFAYVESYLIKAMQKALHLNLVAESTEFHSITSLLIAVTIACPASVVWYAMNSRKMLARVAVCAERVRAQKVQLDEERKKADALLAQILPPSIIAAIKRNQTPYPRAYDEATVFFGAVDNFVAFANYYEPIQVIKVLNDLYTYCDVIIEQYDAYKVETIGDTYLMASGVPKRNGHKHSFEISKMALKFLTAMKTFQPPCDDSHLQIRFRIGINTGSLVAGVIGLRNKRYCLFGDTVNVASRMMSCGKASRILISTQTKMHLDAHFPGHFETQKRGPLYIKGKGVFVTYWLTK